MTMSEVKELKEHVRWLKDELSAANTIDGDLENIDGALTEIKSDLGNFIETFNHNTKETKRLFDAFNGIADAINQHIEVLNKLRDGYNRHTEVLRDHTQVLRELIGALAPKGPAPPSPRDLKTTNKLKERAANRKPRKTKHSAASNEGDGRLGDTP